MNYTNPNPFLFCDEIYCMGIKENHYRRVRAQNQFEFMGLNVTWINAIKNNKHPRKGCLQTHQIIFRKAKLEKQKNILIFEDDVRFLYSREKTYSILLEAIKALPENYHALYLGIRIGTQGDKESRHLYSLISGKLTHAVIFNETCFDKIIDSKNKCMDRCMVEEIQPLARCYFVDPELAVQNG